MLPLSETGLVNAQEELTGFSSEWHSILPSFIFYLQQFA